MKEFNAEQAHAAVARGAAWLDKRCPDWIREIDCDELDLGDPNHCVLGQTATCLTGEPVWADYLDVLMHFKVTSRWARHRGFEAPIYDRAPCYEMLTIAWREYIRQRLGVVS